MIASYALNGFIKHLHMKYHLKTSNDEILSHWERI